MIDIEINRDNLILRGSWETPATSNYDVAILFHGFTGNRHEVLLDNLAQRLLEKGIAVLRIDFNGHGQSDGLFKKMTVLNEIADAKAILDCARTLAKGNRIYVLGHSQGGVVASMLAGYYPEHIAKLILLAPAATLKDDALKGICMDVTYDPNNVPDEVVVMGMPIDGFYFRVAQLLPIYEVAANYFGPVCLIHGEGDTVVAPTASIRYYQVYQTSELHLIKDANHSFSKPHLDEVVALATDFL